MSEKNKFKNRLGVVYSSECTYDYDYDETEETLPKNQQQLIVSLDRKGRKSKQA